MQSRSGRTKYKVKTIGRLKDRKSGKVIKSFKESGGGRKPLIGKKTGGVMKAMGGKMAKGYSKGGARMMRASGGKMAKGYAVGGILAGGRAAVKGVTALRAAAKKLGYGLTKVKTPKPTTMKKSNFLNKRIDKTVKYGGAAGAGMIAQEQMSKKNKKTSAFGTAFSNARKSGKKTFTYKGKKYTTKVKK